MFFGSDTGGRTAAILTSFITTCKRHDVDPFSYLRDVFRRISAHPAKHIHELLPDEWKEDAYHFMKDISKNDRERFYAIHLDSQNHVIGVDEVSVGTLIACLLHPREVFKSAILNSAAAIILAHNHPSGNIMPSHEDHQTTRKLYECGELLGIDVFDSLIIGEDQYYSAKEMGEL